MKKISFIRILSTLLAILLLATSLVACNNDTPTNTPDNSDTEDAAPVTYPKATTLSSYKIVYSEGASDYVKTKVVSVINNAMQSKYGVTLEAISDSTEAAPYEIVLGETNRFDDVSKAHFDSLRGAYSLDGKNTLTYGTGIAYSNNRVYLLAKSDDALFNVANYFCANIESQVNDKKEFTPNDEPYFSSVAKTEDSPYLAEGSDLRVMSYNILMSQYAAIESNKRDLRMANILMYYMPDVVALQETEELWHTLIDKYLVAPGIFAKAAEKAPSGAYNMTTFLYNPKTVKLISTDIREITKNSNVRLFVVCEFERLSDGSHFVVTNFHPAPSGSVQEYETHFKRLYAVKDQALAKYKDLPIIMMGDFNTGEDYDMYPKFMSNLGVKDAKYEAETLVRRYGTYLKGGPYGTLQKGDVDCVDHIFVNGNLKVNLFNVVIDHGVTLTSDHLPIYADITFN